MRSRLRHGAGDRDRRLSRADSVGGDEVDPAPARLSMAAAGDFQSGPPSGSILMTSAPRSASIMAAAGPATYWPKSIARIPDKALSALMVPLRCRLALLYAWMRQRQMPITTTIGGFATRLLRVRNVPDDALRLHVAPMSAPHDPFAGCRRAMLYGLGKVFNRAERPSR